MDSIPDRWRRYLRLLMLLLLAATWSSCKELAENYFESLGGASGSTGSGATFEDVSASDATLIPALRYQHELHLPNLQLGEGDQLLLDLSLSSGDGDFGLNLPAGRSTMVGGTVLSGDPDGNLDGKVSMLEAGIALDIRQRPFDWATTDFLFGIGYHDLSLSLGSASATGKEDYHRFGVMVGGRGAAAVTDWMNAYVRGSLLLMPAHTSSLQVEGGLEFRIAEHADLQLGYRFWNYHHDHGPTEYDVELTGVVAGLTVHF